MIPYRIALYMRLSKGDDNNGEESNSISMQRMMLKNYVAAHFSDYSLLEYVDDGYTGTNFNRPAMQRMLEGVKRAELDCIVVKDFSRFARDYIELGSYLEQIFPFMGIRFISVNDRYDSKDCRGCIQDMDINFKNLLYDLYSKDLSQKVRSSLKAKKAKGQYISANCPFGYEKAPNDRHMLVIAEDEAKLVKRIFNLTLEGHSSTQIAKQFNEEGIKTPIQFKMEKGRTTKVPKGGIFLWHPSFICQALKNRIYVGDIVYGKYEKEFVGGKNHLMPREQWKIFYNHHEPIVTREIFAKVQVKRGETRACQYRETHPLVGKAVCGCCGRNLRYCFGLNPYFRCQGRYSNGMKRKGMAGSCVDKVNAMFLEEYVLFFAQKKLTESEELRELYMESKKIYTNDLDIYYSFIQSIIIHDEQNIELIWGFHIS